MALGPEKLEQCPYQDIKNCDNRPDIHSFKHSTGIGQTDRQTDGRNWYNNVHALRAEAR